MVKGVLEQQRELDQAIDRASVGWKVERMPVVDRAVLRLALYELRFEPSTPMAVVIDEAVELAKTYSTERSGRFVNGVLSKLAPEERAADSLPTLPKRLEQRVSPSQPAVSQRDPSPSQGNARKARRVPVPSGDEERPSGTPRPLRGQILTAVSSAVCRLPSPCPATVQSPFKPGPVRPERRWP